MTTQTEQRSAAPGFRPDVQGLRAVAVGTVLLFHALPGVLPGGFVGVDVFFVISGFLITGLLLREAESDGRISLARFWARRARRILPAAAVVLVVVAIASVLLLPMTRWQDVAWQVVASATYVQNWVLAAGTDYLNAGEPATPLQHYWSLAVEEQFYLVWPLLIVAVIALARRRGRGIAMLRRDATIGILLVVVPSLAWSVVATAATPAPAYFTSTTRVWELGVGALAAVLAPRLASVPRGAAVVLGWVGVAAIAAAAIAFDADTPFPGSAALLPVLGAAAIIVAGLRARDGISVARVLSVRPMTWIGDLSYSLYLWHWPVIVFATAVLGGLDPVSVIAVGVLSLGLAMLSRRYIEQPALRAPALARSTRRALIAGAAVVVVGAASSAFVWVPIAQASVPPTVPALGATALATDPSAGEPENTIAGGFTPSAVDAADDNPDVYADGCFLDFTEVEPRTCTYGPDDADYTVAIVGDSHAAQWVPPLQTLADERGWKLETFTKSRCPLIDAKVSLSEGGYDEPCAQLNAAVIDELTGPDRPDYVLLGSAGYTTSEGTAVAGFERAWSRLTDAGVPFAVIQDTPRAGIDIPECVATHPDELTACGVPRTEALPNGGADQYVAAATLGVPLLDLNDWICPDPVCPAVIGNVLVYRDAGHLGATYAATLAEPLGDAIDTLGVPQLR
jgi:peptidoglycan/LPS O-acetylase OafA/YrhL